MKTALIALAVAAALAGRESSEPARVTPGLVRWHADVDAARAAAVDSGKPVLHFQLLGRLDEALC